MRTRADVRQRLLFYGFTPWLDSDYRRRVTVEGASVTGPSRSTAAFGIASITSMPRLWQMFASPAGSAHR